MQELYEKLLQQWYIGTGKIRTHTSKVAWLVRKYTSINEIESLSIAQGFILKYRRHSWQVCLEHKLYWTTTLSDVLEELLDRHYLKQSRHIWGDIKEIIRAHNAKFPSDVLPVDKINIAIALFWRRNMTLMEFVYILWLSPKYIRHSSGENSTNLVPLWRDSLWRVCTIWHRSATLFEHLKDAVYTPADLWKWQKNILSILHIFYEISSIHLGFGSWATLSRGIKGSNHDYISQDDFVKFIRELSR